ncbi:MAG: hypothetical protein ACRD5G_12255 [Candidatus Acidiferrales bacterium]
MSTDKREAKAIPMQRARRIFALMLLALSALLLLALGLEEFRHKQNYGHFAPYGLHVDLIVRKADIGIPGITKMYEAYLYNLGLPVSIQRCDFVSDAMEPGTMVAYAVQRWNAQTSAWDTIVESSGAEYCVVTPLSMVVAASKDSFLFPGQSVSTGWEATAARDEFAKGDSARFVVFTTLKIDAGRHFRSVPSQAFVIDEQAETAVPLRIRH